MLFSLMAEKYSIHLLSMDGHLDCFLFWLLLLMLQWTQRCRYECEMVISIPSDKYPAVILLDHTFILLWIVWGTCQFTFPPTAHRAPLSPHPPEQLLSLVFFRVAILLGVRWRCSLNVVLFCLFWPWDMWDLSSPIRDRNCTPNIGGTES